MLLYCSDPTRKKRIVTLTDTQPKRTHESADCQARFDTPRIYWHLELLSSFIFEKSQTVTFKSQASNKECLDLLIVIWRELMFGPSLVLKKEKNFTRKETLSELTISRQSSATWYTQALLLNTKQKKRGRWDRDFQRRVLQLRPGQAWKDNMWDCKYPSWDLIKMRPSLL